MLRALYFSYMLPYPPYSGYQLRVWNICKQLSRKMNQTILCRVFAPISSENIQQMSQDNIRLETVVIPRPSFSRKLIKAFPFVFKSYPIRAAAWYFPMMKGTLKKLIAGENFDCIIIEGSYYGVYWPCISKTKALKVLDLHNIEEELLWRNASTLPINADKFLHYHDAIKMRYLENKLMKGVDLIFVTSERERAKLSERKIRTPVYVVPNGVDCDAIHQLPFSNENEILFIGAMDHFPNADAIAFFTSNIFPGLRRDFPDLKFRIVGRSPAAEIKKLNSKPGIKVAGQVEDLEPYYRRCALCVVPLRSGSGTRLKILEAMAYGRPVVSTTIGCEGIEALPNKHILIADTAQEISNAISSLLVNPAFVGFLVSNARSLVEEKYSWAKIADGVFKQYVAFLDKKGK